RWCVCQFHHFRFKINLANKNPLVSKLSHILSDTFSITGGTFVCVFVCSFWPEESVCILL
ncbi:MAG: hypothetical protein WBF04_09020, partial [Candidatus Sulfotelmatobacter sp.]